MTKNQLLTIFLALFIFTIPFLALPSSSLGTYDPWADTNEDGKIDIRDISYTAKLFGTTGDTTKNVTVTNWPAPYMIQTVSLNCPFTNLYNNSGMYYYYGDSTTPVIYVGSYSRMWIYLIPPNPNSTSEYAIANYNVTHKVVSIDWTDDLASSFSAYETLPNTQSNTTVSVDKNRVPPQTPMMNYFAQIYDNPIETKAPYLRLHIQSQTFSYSQPCDPGWMKMTVKIYLRND